MAERKKLEQCKDRITELIGGKQFLSSCRLSKAPDEKDQKSDMECSICADGIFGKSSKCGSCDNMICETCAKTKTEYEFYDWCTVQLKCEQCKNTMCRDCIRFCSNCANETGSITSLCPDCADSTITIGDCEDHRWMSCDEHDNKGKCGECFASSNFHGKHSQ